MIEVYLSLIFREKKHAEIKWKTKNATVGIVTKSKNATVGIVTKSKNATVGIVTKSKNATVFLLVNKSTCNNIKE